MRGRLRSGSGVNDVKDVKSSDNADLAVLKGVMKSRLMLQTVGNKEGDAFKWKERRTKCKYCKELGHNARSCTAKKLDSEKMRQEDEENEETLQQKLDDLQKAQNEMFADQDLEMKKPPRFKKLAGIFPRCSPLKDGKQLLVHGVIVKHFKPPAQTGPSGVEYFERDGQNYTAPKQLQAALRNNKGPMV
ncbi:hypothetical protein DCAR_0101548 [Daucus carota subsp. sativus]|uniref:Uncharacterized protein n=1 Tax=Daucus carota subsp. sativus TaxID=79200 RepID=A0A166GGP7_DAUCS|nr:hypothetical protein DCAR_0101548 [Daucus carota subsp. sativus]